MLNQYEKEQLKSLLIEFCDFLVDHGIVGNITIVGGAALIMEYGEQRATTDFDAIISDDSNAFDVINLSKKFAEIKQLDPFWFNDEVMLVKPPKVDIASHELFNKSGLKVSIASPQYLLAMKINSFRPDSRDLFDAVYLCNILDINSARDIHEIYMSIFESDDGINHRIIGVVNEIEKHNILQTERDN